MNMIHVKGSTYYIPGHVCVGVYVRGKECMLIDTGLDNSTARNILKELREAGLTPTVIVNTHSHADHIGGNHFIQKRMPVSTYVPDKEISAVQYPLHEPGYLFSAAPLKEMQNKFFMARPSNVDGGLKPGRVELNGFEADIVSLQGHSMDQIGVVTADNVLFCGDAVISSEIISKYSCPYVFDVGNHLNTLEYLKGTGFEAYVMAHGRMVKDIRPDAERNMKVMTGISDFILELLKQPATREDLIAEYVKGKNIDLSMIQYPLLLGAISAHLSYMADNGLLKYYFEEGKLYWTAA